MCVYNQESIPISPTPTFNTKKKKKKKKKKAQESMIGPLSYSPKNPQTDADIKIQ
jgi:hypothetical protein